MEQELLQLLADGHTQSEAANILKEKDFQGSSRSSIEKKLNSIRKQYNAKTNFQLAVILKSKKIIK